MLDNVKFKKENVNPSILTNFKWKKLKENKYKKRYFFRLRNNRGKLILVLEVIKNTGIYNLIVSGSIRKWYYGANLRRDLSKNDLVKALLKLSKVLNMELIDIVDAKISKIEVGTTIVLKPHFRKLLKGLVFYPRLKRRHMYDGETLYFGWKNESSYSMIFYDKLKEINKNNKQVDNLEDKIFFCRYEISFNVLSKVVKHKDTLNSFRKILRNWDEVKTMYVNTYNKIWYCDYMSKSKSNITETKFEKYRYIRRNGVPNIFDIIDKENSNNKTNKKKQVLEFVEKNSLNHYSELKLLFFKKLNIKLERLSKVRKS